ncbi:P-loop containing nucleoside triphosphate hydrolase protein [Suillus paluster]|uniref:P-loop containing nucleoside triphosphate hydrolase protein n=1 Tax=Suillus paluster TaxID=48578 RepID=UPI001B864C35|nr:P-loop containing nucleoside triphosphate hydrolase protein [Suillus paluster]KAG1731844.1 P-loop containing nucleoside triphosphate hydrolase protein [Suillus paluster]
MLTPLRLTTAGVGLSNPTLSLHRRRNARPNQPFAHDRVGLFPPQNDFDSLRQYLVNSSVQADMDLPMIAVIGSQSAGKSSLIESISGITLPRSAGTCTRCPTECKLARSEEAWKCIVKLHITTGPSGQPCDVTNVSFGPPITNKADVEDRIRRAQRAILNPSIDAQKFLYDSELDERTAEQAELSFSKNSVSLEISGKDVADLSFVDLPGLIASVGSSGKDGDIELVKGLVASYIKKASCVILLTVTCETDFENQGAHHLAKQYDPEGKRTVGVLTKPDRIPPGEEYRWLRFIRNEHEPLVNHWYCVKQPGSLMLQNGISWAEARKQENDFFTLTQPWSTVESQYQKFMCTSNLTEQLSTILSELIAKRLPEIHQELYDVSGKTQEEMRKLPKAPSNDAVAEVWHVVSEFLRQLSRRLEGTPDADGILQTIRPHQQAFKRAIRATAPQFVPRERGHHREELPVPEFLANEEELQEPEVESVVAKPNAESVFNFTSKADSTAPFVFGAGAGGVAGKHTPNSPTSVNPQSSKIYLDDVFKHAQRARTRELPDNYPFIVQKMYIEEFTKKWALPSTVLFDKVYDVLKKDLNHLVREHFGKMGRGGTNHTPGCRYEAGKGKVDWLLELEKMPTTLNVHYYSDYKDKFLAYYKGCRDEGELIRKLQNYKAPSASPHKEAFQIGVNKALAGLNEAGISVHASDLLKLLPVDPMEPALVIMAGVRAYFQVAYKRFSDMVPMAIDHEVVRGLEKGMEHALRDGLNLTGPDAEARCRLMVQEHSTVVSKRTELQKKLDRLQAASLELRKLFV